MNTSNYKVSVLNIEINFEEIPITSSSKILPLPGSEKYNKSPNDQAVADYNAFIVNLWEAIEYIGFTLEGEPKQSSNNSYSYYFDFFATDDDGNVVYKCIVHLRVSDHPLREYEGSNKNRNKYYKEQSETLESKYNMKKIRYKFKNIVVNGESYDSYDDALEDIENELKITRNKLLK